MAMNREIYLKQISDTLATLRLQVENRNSLQLYDINILAEDLIKELLNLVYGYNLKNVNIAEKHAAAIDLGDTKMRVAIQVTSDNSSTKIRDTVDKFNEKKLYEKYERLIILIIAKKKAYRKDYGSQSLFFRMEILDIFDLLLHIGSLETSKLEKIKDFLEREFEVKRRQVGKSISSSESNEVVTIMKLIEFLSDHEDINITGELEEEPNPENKIYRRFSHHSEFLISQYQELVAIYGAKLSKLAHF